jgi:hypothetical protein
MSVGVGFEHILDEGYLEGIEDLSTEDLRRMRAECEAQEEAVSYARRVLQGRLDILRAELLRRSDDGDERADSLLELLPTILASDQASSDPLKARATRLRVPEAAEVLEAEIDRIVDESTLEELGDHGPADLAGLLDRLAEHEQRLSRVRRTLFERIDTLREELAARYKDGRAVVSDLIGGT